MCRRLKLSWKQRELRRSMSEFSGPNWNMLSPCSPEQRLRLFPFLPRSWHLRLQVFQQVSPRNCSKDGRTLRVLSGMLQLLMPKSDWLGPLTSLPCTYSPALDLRALRLQTGSPGQAGSGRSVRPWHKLCSTAESDAL